jgi:hypothetical protein
MCATHGLQCSVCGMHGNICVVCGKLGSRCAPATVSHAHSRLQVVADIPPRLMAHTAPTSLRMPSPLKDEPSCTHRL